MTNRSSQKNKVQCNEGRMREQDVDVQRTAEGKTWMLANMNEVYALVKAKSEGRSWHVRDQRCDDFMIQPDSSTSEDTLGSSTGVSVTSLPS